MRSAGVLLCLAALICSAAPSGAAPERPNVVIFLADDLGWADVGFHGNTQIDTPSLDRLAREGMELSRFYTTPICSPTRAALMTGRDPIRLGVVYAVLLPWTNAGIHPDEHFMPQSFPAAGYQTAMVGKWHLGHAQQTYHPNERGFEHFYGHLHTEVGYFPPFSNQGGKDFQRNGTSRSTTRATRPSCWRTRPRAGSGPATRRSPSSCTCPSSRPTRRWTRRTT